MSTYFSFHPEHFNNNGDQGNLEVLGFFLKAQGIDFESTEDISSADFVLIGDASRAAVRNYGKELLETASALHQRHASGMATLIVGSSFEFLASKVPWMAEPEYGAPVSEFRTLETVGGESVLGYRNSKMLGSDFILQGNFITTTFFGPILAKNPDLLDQILIACGGLAAEWSQDMKTWVEKIRDTRPD